MTTMTIFNNNMSNGFSFVHKGNVVVPKHLRFRLKAIQRRIDSSSSPPNNEATTSVQEEVRQRSLAFHTEKTPTSTNSDQRRTVETTTAIINNSKKQKQKRNVQFAPMAKVLLVRRLTRDEFKQVWYTADEYRKFDHDRRRTIQMIHEATEYNRTFDKTKYTGRGLEKYFDPASLLYIYKNKQPHKKRRSTSISSLVPTSRIYSPTKMDRIGNNESWQKQRQQQQEEYDRTYPMKQPQLNVNPSVYCDNNNNNNNSFHNYHMMMGYGDVRSTTKKSSYHHYQHQQRLYNDNTRFQESFYPPPSPIQSSSRATTTMIQYYTNYSPNVPIPTVH